MHTFTVELTNITFQSPDDYVIAAATLDPEQAPGVNVLPWTDVRCKAIKGTLPGVQKGDILDVMGDFASSKYGKQFIVASFVRCVANTNRAIVAFLRGFPQIGPTRARAIVDHFGGHAETMAIMAEDHERLTEISGISEERAVDIHNAFVAATGRRDAATFLAGIPHLTEVFAARIMDKWGGKTRELLTVDPYILMEIKGINFAKADQLAADLGVVGNDPRRAAAAAQYILAEACDDGHTWATLDQLAGNDLSYGVKRALRDTGIAPALIEAGLDALSKPRRVGDHVRSPAVVVERGRYYPAALYQAEVDIASHLRRILNG